jgi:hypothetical protein
VRRIDVEAARDDYPDFPTLNVQRRRLYPSGVRFPPIGVVDLIIFFERAE